MTTLTNNESEVMSAINNIIDEFSEWGMVAEITPAKMLGLTPRAIAGTLGSLVKKGMVDCDKDEGVDWVKFTPLGLENL